jgi:HD-GYP domain-containing protein (c-di-GMP phosphodiesterase class II)
VPDAILLKPAVLTEEEWALMQRHSDEGARIIDRLGFLNDAVPAIRHHHERFDGTGYPDQLAGDHIPLGARIIAVCDAFDAMTSERAYAPALTIEEGLKELFRCAGTQFDPQVVEAFYAVQSELRAELVA